MLMFALDHSFLPGIDESNAVLEPRAAEIVGCVLFHVDNHRQNYSADIMTSLSQSLRLFENLAALPQPSEDLVFLWTMEPL